VKLERWDIVFVPAHEKDAGGHPAVVLSPPDILEDDRQMRLNVLMGSKRVPAENAKPHQVVLNGADGLEFAPLWIVLSSIKCAKRRLFGMRDAWRMHVGPGSRRECGRRSGWAERGARADVDALSA
jgi:hypothetical protein